MAEKPNLQVEILPSFAIRNPLMIASSHLTANTNALRQLARVRPSAITLKSTSSIVGGTGEGERFYARVLGIDGEVSGIYTDGKKTTEFLNVEATRSLLKSARELLPETTIGLGLQSISRAEIRA